MAIDAAEERIAAGDETGRISMWNAFGPAAISAAEAPAQGAASDSAAGQAAPAAVSQREQKRRKKDYRDAGLAKETLHWHSGPVRCLVFSPDSTYLLSGGDEAVLVGG